jgi:hypothetical protein
MLGLRGARATAGACVSGFSKKSGGGARGSHWPPERSAPRGRCGPIPGRKAPRSTARQGAPRRLGGVLRWTGAAAAFGPRGRWSRRARTPVPARRVETDTARVGAAPSRTTFPRTHPPHGEDQAHPSEALRPLQGAQHRPLPRPGLGRGALDLRLRRVPRARQAGEPPLPVQRDLEEPQAALSVPRHGRRGRATPRLPGGDRGRPLEAPSHGSSPSVPGVALPLGRSSPWGAPRADRRAQGPRNDPWDPSAASFVGPRHSPMALTTCHTEPGVTVFEHGVRRSQVPRRPSCLSRPTRSVAPERPSLALGPDTSHASTAPCSSTPSASSSSSR